MAQRTPRDEREWRSMVERSLREAKSGMRPLIAAAIDGIVVPPGSEGDTRHPTAPIELTYQTALYLDTIGRQRVRFILDFPDVTKATDGTDLVIQKYELWGKPVSAPLLLTTTDAVAGLAVPGLTMPALAATPDNVAISEEPLPWVLVATNTESFFRAENFLPGSLWDFRARAIGTTTTIPGEWSIVVTVQMLPDTTPPGQPTAPVLTVGRGTITATWDGQSVSGAMPADFKYCVLAHGTTSSPTFEIARFGRGGGFKVVADFPYYDPQFFRLQAVDESGNRSPWSEQAVGYTTPLVDTDIILSEIDAAQTHLKNINAGVSILPNTIITEHLVVTQSMAAAIGGFLYLKAGQIDVNNLWADSAFFGLADARLVRSDMFLGKTFDGGTFTGALFQTDVEAYTGIKLDSSGMQAWSTSGVNTFTLNAATGDLSVYGGTITGAVFQTDMAPTTGIKMNSVGINAYAPGGVNTFSVSAANGMVTTTGRVYTSLPGEPGIAIIPSVESWNELDMGVWFAHDSHFLPGLITAGVWMADPGESGVLNLSLRGSNYGGVTAWYGLTLAGGGSYGVVKSIHQIRIDSANDVILDAGGGNTVNLNNGAAAYNMTSSGAANVYMYTTGQLFKSTSSLRYKTDVQDWTPGLAALGLRPRSWVDRNPADPALPLQRYYGFIAEEVEQVLPEMITLNEFGEPETVQYERIAAALVPVIMDMMGRIEALEGN